MDDILASIRRILDEEGPKVEHQDTPAPAPHAAPHTGGVLELDDTMMIPEPEEVPAPPVPPPPAVVEQVVAPPPAPFAVPMPVPAPVSGPDLVAPAAAAAASASVGSLLRALASERTVATHRGGPTIEDVVREEMRPLLKEWLDLHLAPLVERLVQAEIERVVNRGV